MCVFFFLSLSPMAAYEMKLGEESNLRSARRDLLLSLKNGSSPHQRAVFYQNKRRVASKQPFAFPLRTWRALSTGG